METDKPLHATARPRDPGFPGKFAEDLLRLFEKHERVSAVATTDGLLLSSIWEPDLEEAFERIRAVTDAEIVFSPPLVHYIETPRRMEPCLKLEVRVPADFIGSVIGDLSSRRGTIVECRDEGETMLVGAKVPLAELFGYCADLSRLTNGTGTASATFFAYETAPENGPWDEPRLAAMRA